MKKKNKVISTFILSLLLSACGFKTINQKSGNLIFIQNINIIDEQRIAYSLKNDILLISDDNSKNKNDVEIRIERKKINKIKDKTGKVTRYQISIIANLQLTNLDSNKKKTKVFIRSGNYDISPIHSETINKEKYLTKNIIQQLSEDIVNYIYLTMRN